MMKGRIEYLDIAKAICIVLVVLGHLNPVPEPKEWAAFVKVIYSFHMPVFLFICGFLAGQSYNRQRNYTSFIAKKFKQLMLPYFGASVLIIGSKLLAQMLVPVKNPVSPVDFLTIFYKPSAAVHLWFIWVLMILFLLAPLYSDKRGRTALLAISAVLWLVPIQLPEFFCLNRLSNSAIFFIAGMFFKDSDSLIISKKKAYIPIISIFVILEALYVCGICDKLLKTILPFAGIAAILSIAKVLSDCCPDRIKKGLLYLGKNTFVIFLFHSAFGEFGRTALSAAGLAPSEHFLVTLLVYAGFGLGFPLLAKTGAERIRLLVKQRLTLN